MAKYLNFTDDEKRQYHDRMLRDARQMRRFAQEIGSIAQTAEQCTTKEHMLVFLKETVKECDEKADRLECGAASYFDQNTEPVDELPDDTELDWFKHAHSFNPHGPASANCCDGSLKLSGKPND